MFPSGGTAVKRRAKACSAMACMLTGDSNRKARVAIGMRGMMGMIAVWCDGHKA